MKLSCWLLLLAAVAHFGLLTTPTVATLSDLENCRIYDITHEIRNNMASFGSLNGAGLIVNETIGNFTVTGSLTIGTHLGTHIDSPAHIFKDKYYKGILVNTTDLRTLMGPVLVVKVPECTNITAEALKSLNLPKGVKRVIFKTANTERRLMDGNAFVGDYTGFTPDGAKWLVKKTEIKFIGIDYMSVATKDDVVKVHKTLLKPGDIIPVENLKLDEVEPGEYTVYCLPLRVMAEAAPARCILLDNLSPGTDESEIPLIQV